MIAYKVVVQETFDGKLASVSGVAGWKVRYIPGEWARPSADGSKLFVFASKCDAEKFTEQSNAYQIWRCEVENPITPGHMFHLLLSPTSWSDYWRLHGWEHSYWEHWRKAGRLAERMAAPEGILLCDAVKLLERVA